MSLECRGSRERKRDRRILKPQHGSGICHSCSYFLVWHQFCGPSQMQRGLGSRPFGYAGGKRGTRNRPALMVSLVLVWNIHTLPRYKTVSTEQQKWLLQCVWSCSFSSGNHWMAPYFIERKNQCSYSEITKPNIHLPVCIPSCMSLSPRPFFTALCCSPQHLPFFNILINILGCWFCPFIFSSC